MDLEQRKSFLNFFQTQYISPFSKLFYQIEAMQRFIKHQPLSTQISNPSSWLTKKYCKQISDARLVSEELSFIREYLDNSGNIFDGEYNAKVGTSIPYFEWFDGQEQRAISDFLGEYLFICLIEHSSLEEITLLCDYIQKPLSSLGTSNILLVGTALERALCEELLGFHDVYWVDSDQIITENLLNKLMMQNESFIKIFNTTKPLLFIDKSGKLKHLFTKQELYKFDEVIVKYLNT